MKTQHGRDLSGPEMAMMLDEFVNSGGRDKVSDFVETITHRTHRTLQQRICSLMLATIEAWANVPGHDARNEATIKICQKIVAATGDKYDRYLPLI